MSTVLASVAKRSAPSSIADVAKILKPKTKRIADLVRQRRIEIKATRGADPECFIQEIATGRIVSAIPILKRDKHDPIDLGAGVKIFADNVLMETSFAPSKTNPEMIKRMKSAFTRMQEHIGDRYRICPRPAHTLDADQLVTMHNINPDEVGCTPSFCSYTLSVVTPAPFNDGMRSSSFHIHLGHEQLCHFATRIKTIKLLDVFVGCASVLYDPDPANVTRRLRYGAAGSHRCPEYGLEYRTLSGGTLRSIKQTSLALDLVEHALEHMRAGTGPDILAMVEADKVQAAINSCDADLAREVLTKAELPSVLMKRVLTDYSQLNMQTEWGLT